MKNIYLTLCIAWIINILARAILLVVTGQLASFMGILSVLVIFLQISVIFMYYRCYKAIVHDQGAITNSGQFLYSLFFSGIIAAFGLFTTWSFTSIIFTDPKLLISSITAMIAFLYFLSSVAIFVAIFVALFFVYYVHHGDYHKAHVNTGSSAKIKRHLQKQEKEIRIRHEKDKIEVQLPPIEIKVIFCDQTMLKENKIIIDNSKLFSKISKCKYIVCFDFPTKIVKAVYQIKAIDVASSATITINMNSLITEQVLTAMINKKLAMKFINNPFFNF